MVQPKTPDAEQIVDIDVSSEMERSFLEYAYSVIYQRALPDARDGLKPVQRRIVFQMDQMGLRPDKGYVKSARVVGDVMGRLHPHGDSAIYDAMVRMAQKFRMLVPLVDGHGNFGSLDDGPAAPRYTEARLTPAAMAMVTDLDQDVVNMIPNYDNKFSQPEVLPAAFPALLVNGALGIAVGMTTRMPPHNLAEVIAGARYLLQNPQATVDELLRYVPGPDLPSGGRIIGLEGVREAYATGRGSFITRATTRLEKVTARKQAIVVTELPYQIGPERVIEQIKKGVDEKKLDGISNVQDLTDRHQGLQLVIEIKHGKNPDAVLEQLYRYTSMEDSFGIINTALVNGAPQTLGLRELLQVFLDHRLEVTTRRTQFRLARAQERAHLLDGLLIAIVDIDKVISIIRTSDDADAARTRLIEAFELSDTQAHYILELRLRRLTKFSRIDLENEREELRSSIAELEAILASEERLRQVVSSELADVAATLGSPRRTVLLESSGHGEQVGSQARSAAAQISVDIPDEPCWVLLSGTDVIARVTDEPLRTGQRAAHDAVSSTVRTTTRSDVGIVTSAGRLIRLDVLHTPAIPNTSGAPSLSGGTPISDLVDLERTESVVGMVSLDDEDPPVVLATEDGVVKRVNVGGPASRDSWEIVTLKDDDVVVRATHAADDDVLVMVTSDAQLLRFPAHAVRPQGRTGQGVAGIRMADGAKVLTLGVVSARAVADSVVVTIAGSGSVLPGTVAGSAKVTPLDRFPAKGRATAGVRAQRFLRGEDGLQLAWVGPSPGRAVGSGGQPVDLPEVDERRDASGRPLAAPVVAVG